MYKKGIVNCKNTWMS